MSLYANQQKTLFVLCTVVGRQHLVDGDQVKRNEKQRKGREMANVLQCCTKRTSWCGHEEEEDGDGSQSINQTTNGWVCNAKKVA